MRDERDQPPGLLPPVRDWTFAGMACGLVLAFAVLAPWVVLALVVWAVLETP